MPITKPATRPADLFSVETWELRNRTGGAIEKGDVLVLDLLQANAATDSFDLIPEISVFENALTPATASLRFPCVVALEDAANGARFRAAVRGRVQAKVIGTDFQTGELGALVNGQRHFVEWSAGNMARCQLVDADAPASAGLRWVLLNGMGYGGFST